VITDPITIDRSSHTISRANISESALKVLYRLKNSDFQGYLVGGGVRDLLLGREPKDFDIATDASPEEVRGLFRNCRLIGRRFRLAHVRYRDEIIEVATFRARQAEASDDDRRTENGLILRDNVYGTLEEDAWRRDFTVNALYYNIADFSVVDHTNGIADLNAGLLRLIGDPETRYREDPVRMLRAVRFATKLGFRIEEKTEAQLWEIGELLSDMPSARLFDEVLKLFHSGMALETFEMLRHYRLFGYLFPATEAALEQEENGFPITFVARALGNTDKRIREGKPVTPAFLMAALLWEPVRQAAAELEKQGENPVPALAIAGDQVISDQVKRIAFPRRFSSQAKEIWTLQPRFDMRRGKRPQRLMANPRFRAAYDFLVLRAESGEADPELAKWWTDIQEVEPAQQADMVAPETRPRRRRRRRSAKPKPE
jgi:poly(A) polymerase